MEPAPPAPSPPKETPLPYGWAEAAAREAADEAVWLDTDELRLRAEAEQQERLVEDAWTATVEAWLKDRAPLCCTTAEVLDAALNIPRAAQNRSVVMQVAKILRDCGWQRLRTGGRAWRWHPPGSIPGRGTLS